MLNLPAYGTLVVLVRLCRVGHEGLWDVEIGELPEQGLEAFLFGVPIDLCNSSAKYATEPTCQTYLRSEAHEEQRKLVEVGCVALEEVRETNDIPFVIDLQEKILMQHVSSFHNRLNNQLSMYRCEEG